MNGQAPCNFQNGCVFLFIASFASIGVKRFPVLLLSFCGVEYNFAIGVGYSQDISLVVVLLVQYHTFLPVGVMEKWLDDWVFFSHYYKLSFNRPHSPRNHTIIKQIMIGSLGEFIDIQGGNVFEFEVGDKEQNESSQAKVTKRRGNSTFQHYVPDDKTDLLVRYEKNNIFNINRKKYNSIAKQAHSKQKIRKPLYEHHSFFVKPQVARDYIAKEELKRKHNLLRAILRMKQNQEQPKGESDYEQSFQRLYSGFRAIHPHPVLSNLKEPQFQGEEITAQKVVAIPASKNTGGLSHIKRLQYEQCLSWAKKHHKKGDFFAKQLGKLDRKQVRDSPKVNRSLIDDIGKKVQFSLID